MPQADDPFKIARTAGSTSRDNFSGVQPDRTNSTRWGSLLYRL